MGSRISLVLLLFGSALAAQTAGAKRDFPVDSITIEGNRILSADAIMKASGLTRGGTGNSDLFDAARDRLLGSGYFDTVSYRYKPSVGRAGAGYEVTFTVKEVDTLYPIRVDALGATTEEIAGFLKAHDPLFTGKMPGTRQVLNRTSKEIEQFLEAKGAPASVAGRVIVVAPGQFEIAFTPARGLPAVSTVTFEGTRVISATDLHNKIAEVAFGQPFTEDGFRVFLENQIRPAYEAKGYMHVTFPKIVSTPSVDVQGVDVKVTVDEGEQYKLTRISVGGPKANDSASILKTAKIPQMTVADFDQIREGAERVKQSMRHQGYLDADVTIDRKRDDEKKTVEAVIVVEPGPEYTFRKLTVLGLGLDGEAAVREMWSVKSGDPFPVEYPEHFVKAVKDEGLFDNLGDLKADPKIDRTAHLVDVTLEFKGASSVAPKAPTRRGVGR